MRIVGNRLIVGVGVCVTLSSSLAFLPQDERSTTKKGSSARGEAPESKAGDDPAKPRSTEEATDANGKVVRTDAEWRALLTRDQYWVTRQKGTEPAFTGKYARGKHKGTFTCVGCGAPLFSSKHKFESGTGWPSFWQPINAQALASADDFSDPFEARVEVMCARCDAHLGHVFQDGPPPTGLRYCINSVALKLAPSMSAGTTKAKSAAAKKAAAKKEAAESNSDESAPLREPAPKPETDPDSNQAEPASTPKGRAG